MKVLVITILCALASCAVGGAIGWPGAIAVTSPLLRTVIPGETKTTAYSTTQYINAVPTSYAFSGQPQFAYHQVPQAFAAVQPTYYQIPGHSFIPASNIFYPSAPSFAPAVAPAFPSAPISPSAPAPAAPGFPQGLPSAPTSQPAGDADSAVVDSADFNAEQQRQDSESVSPSPTGPSAPQPTQPAAPQFPPFPPSNTFPNFPTIPQNPQESGQIPSFPQLPQIPQIPGFPQFPPNPFPQGPSSQPPPASFPAPINQDKGLNDEDTISVESA